MQQNVGFKEHAVPVKCNDLLSVCKEGKLKEAIELLGQSEVADPECFRVLFGFVGSCRIWNRLRRYAGNRLGDYGLEMYDQMRNNGFPPNKETFLTVLDLCVGADAIEEGFIHFEAMQKEYEISLNIEHYLGVIGCYGKLVYLVEALEYIQTLPFEPTAEIWETVMNYARIHGDIDLEDRCEEILISLDPSKVNPKEIPTPLPKKYTAISMLEGKKRDGEFRYPTLYKDEEKIRAANKE
nr:pentatricopeptide repeat-containing protein At2g15690 [Tanacetum cinerariifolium]